MDDLSDDVIKLRRVTTADVDEWLEGEDEEQIRWFEFPRPATRADVERAINAWRESWLTDGPVRHWGICDRSSGALAGGVELRAVGSDIVNLSYVVFPGWRRRGFATRASRLALAYGRRVLGVKEAVVKVLEDNVASLGVARNLGAVEVGAEASDAGSRLVVLRVDLVDERAEPHIARARRRRDQGRDGSEHVPDPHRRHAPLHRPIENGWSTSDSGSSHGCRCVANTPEHEP